ncbi:MAG: PhoH family protein [Nitrospinota bacterium]|nr:PhoH family protein [Nitrospinota bacterium]
MSELYTQKLVFEHNHLSRKLFGVKDQHLILIEKKFKVRVTTGKDCILIKGEEEDASKVYRLLQNLLDLLTKDFIFRNRDFKFILSLWEDNDNPDIKKIFSERIETTSEKGYITPRSIVQYEYVYAIDNFDVVIGIGPAGTGKTYLAMAKAVSALQKKKLGRIVLVRPAVEAGEKLGYLPGDILEKINPYLRPLYDALYDMVGMEQARQMVENGIVEIASLAFMRGRTLNDSFIILDEAQNSTPEQMKMFLTRLGFNSKVVITGDITQIDLPGHQKSGLVETQHILKGVKDIEFIHFSERDVVRNDVVKKVIKAYEKYEEKKYC